MYYANYNFHRNLVFTQDHIQVNIFADYEQQLISQLTFQDGSQMVATIVYAKYDKMESIALRDDIYSMSHNRVSWMAGGEFNVITNEEENIGGMPVYPNKYEDFAFCINSCNLVDVKFKGSPFTWGNGRVDEQCIFKRLDRIVVNQEFLGIMDCIEMEHLARTGSDHALLLRLCGDHNQ